MTVMAILQDVDKCMRCNGCVTACKREWKMKLPTDISEVIPQKSIVGKRQRLAIKSLKRGDMGPFMRFSCWHCPDPPCAAECPLGAIKKAGTGAIYVDNDKCNPNLCSANTVKPCEFGCQRGGYPKVGDAYESGPYAGLSKANKCTLCYGRAGADTGPDKVNADTALPTRAAKVGANWISELTGAAGPDELAHEPACVSSCPAKAMKWDSKANILAYLKNSANGYTLANGTQNWYGNGAVYWASKKVMLTPPKADPFVEDHIAPMASSMLSSGRMIVPTLVLRGMAALSTRKAKVAAEEAVAITEEV
jgi:Fe-S-cluster-containing dehydrogenase component